MLRNIVFMTVGMLLVLYFDSASAASSSADASATIKTPIAVSTTTNLSFGDVYPDKDADGTVTVGLDGSRSATGGVFIDTSAGTAATFSVSGEASHAYAVSLPQNSITITSGSNTMTVNNFAHNGGGNLDANGAASFNVGATLQVNANQTAGTYTGSFDVTVEYN